MLTFASDLLDRLPDEWRTQVVLALLALVLAGFLISWITKFVRSGDADVWIGMVQAAFGWGSRTLRTRSVRRRLRGEFNSWSARFNERYFAYDPARVNSVDIRVAEHGDIDEMIGRLEGGEVLLYLDPDASIDKNRVRMMTWLVGAMGITDTYRDYLLAEVADAFELTLARKFLAEVSPASLPTFQQHIYTPAMQTDRTMRYCARMQTIDDAGLFETAVIPTLRAFGRSVVGSHPRVRHKEDTAAFVRWVHDMAARPPGDDSVPLSFAKHEIRCAFSLIGARSAQLPISVYRHHIDEYLDLGYDYVFVMARDVNIPAARRVAAPFESDVRVARVVEKTFMQKIDAESVLSLALAARYPSAPVATPPTTQESAADADVLTVAQPSVRPPTTAAARAAVCITVERSPSAAVRDGVLLRERPDDALTIGDLESSSTRPVLWRSRA